MAKVNMHEAKTHFSKLVELALQGEEVIIARSGKAVVRLVPVEGVGALRPVGLNRQETDDDFVKRSLEPLSEEELALWYNPKLLPGDD
jgi:prevent-host-death family protein